MQQVITKLSFPREGAQVGVGSGNDPSVDWSAARRAHPPDGLILDGGQQFSLEPNGKARQFVEKEAASVSRLEQSDARRLGIGERAPLVTKKFGLSQRIRQRRAIQLHQGLVRPGAMPMDPTGDRCLARTRLALNEDRWEARPQLPIRLRDLEQLLLYRGQT